MAQLRCAVSLIDEYSDEVQVTRISICSFRRKITLMQLLTMPTGYAGDIECISLGILTYDKYNLKRFKEVIIDIMVQCQFNNVEM